MADNYSYEGGIEDMPKKLSASLLNLVPVREGHDVDDAIADMIDLAKHVDGSGYTRYWVAEHHNTTSIASSATRQLIHHILHHTESLRVGSGGVMLPNHSPLIVAEEFGTMQAIFGDRLDIGLGRAPGTDMRTAAAIRRNNHDGVYTFASEVEEIRDLLSDRETQVVAFPGNGTNIPLYILGSSTDSAHIAAQLGLPYAFAAHFAPGQMEDAFKIYESEFEPSDQLSEPYKIACLNVICADTDEAAKYLSTTLSQFVLNVIRRWMIWNRSGHLMKSRLLRADSRWRCLAPMTLCWKNSGCSRSSSMSMKSWQSAISLIKMPRSARMIYSKRSSPNTTDSTQKTRTGQARAGFLYTFL